MVTPPSPAVEREVFLDMARRALMVAPVVLVVAGLVWGADGVWSAAYAGAVVVANFALSALFLTRAARLGPTGLMAAVMGGFIVRMGLVLVALIAVRDASWAERAPVAITLLASHLGLLVWEARHLSISLAFPGLKPRRGDR